MKLAGNARGAVHTGTHRTVPVNNTQLTSSPVKNHNHVNYIYSTDEQQGIGDLLMSVGEAYDAKGFARQPEALVLKDESSVQVSRTMGQGLMSAAVSWRYWRSSDPVAAGS